MRDKNRIQPFLNQLGKLWEENCPDWRFGQLISNVLNSIPCDPFFPEDDKMIKYFEDYFKNKK